VVVQASSWFCFAALTLLVGQSEGRVQMRSEAAAGYGAYSRNPRH